MLEMLEYSNNMGIINMYYFRPENGFKYTDKMDLFFKVRQFSIFQFIKMTFFLFQYAEMMNLPDGLIDMIDEFSDARQEALDNRETCKEMYSDCPSETLIGIMKRFTLKK